MAAGVRRGKVLSNNRKFAFDDVLRREYRWDIDATAPICPFYGVSACPKGRFCRDQHIVPSYSHKIVCRHWLRGLCKLGDHCEYLHELDMSRVVECPTLLATGSCPIILECPFRHPKTQAVFDSCPNYDKGFCKLGPRCPKKHIRRDMCLRYLTGFCPLGPNCDNAHAKFVHIDDSMRIARDLDQETAPTYFDMKARANHSVEPAKVEAH